MAIAAIRYNNPGNVSLPIRGYDGPGEIVGIKGQSGYASFPTMQDGLNAQTARLASYVNNGVNGSGPLTTISALNSRYAEDPNWKNAVSRFSGIGVNEQIDPNNAGQMQALQGGIIRQETGMDPSRFGLGGTSSFNNGTTAPMNTNNPTDLSGQSGLSAPANASALSGGAGYAGTNGAGNYYYNPQTGAVTPTTDANPPGTSEGFGIIDRDKGVLYGGGTGPYSSGLPGGTGVPTTGFDSTGGFTAANAGVFGNTATPNGVTGLGAPGTGSAYSLQGATLDKGVSAQSVTGGSGGGGGGGGTAGGSMTVPQAIDTQTRGNASDTSSINQQTSKNTDSLNKTSTANTKTATDKAQSIYDTATKSGADYFVRIVFIVVGLIALAAGLMLFKPVQQAAGAVASKLPGV